MIRQFKNKFSKRCQQRQSILISNMHILYVWRDNCFFFKKKIKQEPTNYFLVLGLCTGVKEKSNPSVEYDDQCMCRALKSCCSSRQTRLGTKITSRTSQNTKFK
jgi:hypothetical protein